MLNGRRRRRLFVSGRVLRVRSIIGEETSFFPREKMSSRMPLTIFQRRCLIFVRRLRPHRHTLTAAGCLSTSSMLFSSLSSINIVNNTNEPSKSDRGSDRAFWNPSRRATDLLLLLNAACFLLQWLSKGALTYWGCKINALILDQGQLWRLITPTFLHSSIVHLAVNAYALHSLGPQVESLAGHKRFMVVYLGSALVGTIASLFLTPQPSLGASGAIFGLGASLGLFYWRHREELGQRSEFMLRQLSITAAVNIFYSLAVKNIDNGGHLGGMVGGALISYLLGPRLVPVVEPAASKPQPPADTGGSPSLDRSVKKGVRSRKRIDSQSLSRPRRFVDSPPLPWLAHPPNCSFSLLPNPNPNPNPNPSRQNPLSNQDQMGPTDVK